MVILYLPTGWLSEHFSSDNQMIMNQEIEVLFVEDNPRDAEMTIRELKKNNFANRLFHVQDGAEALDFLFNERKYSGGIEHSIKLILLDLNMPKISGKETLLKIKADSPTRKIPVLVLPVLQ
jgi:two-component system, response regulator